MNRARGGTRRPVFHINITEIDYGSVGSIIRERQLQLPLQRVINDLIGRTIANGLSCGQGAAGHRIRVPIDIFQDLSGLAIGAGQGNAPLKVNGVAITVLFVPLTTSKSLPSKS